MNFHKPVPRKIGLLPDADFHFLTFAVGVFNVRFAGREKVDIEVVAFSGVQQFRQRGKKAREIGWAASAAEPFAALHIFAAFQRVRIKKASPESESPALRAL